MKTHKRVSIIAVNYKQERVTNEMLASLQKVNWPNIEIIVVDNGYDPQKKTTSIDAYPNLTIIRSPKNQGFAGGNNLGIKKAKGEYILLLNNDTEVKSDFIEHMVELFESNPNIGAVSPLIKYWDNPSYIQYAGFTTMNKITQRIDAVGHKQKDVGQFTKAGPTNFAHGCALMIPKHVIDKVGMMNEDYFLYYEEHDWSQRIKDAGYQIFFQPKSIVLHKESISTGKSSTLKTYFLNRNRIKFMTYHNKGACKLMSYIYLYIFSVPLNLLRYTVQGRFNHLNAYTDAIIWTLTHKTKKRWIF